MHEALSSNTDEQLVTRYTEGCDEAFNEIVERWRQPLHQFALRLTGNPDDASELLQRTFIKAYQKLGTLDQKNRLKAWLFQVLMNQFRDFQRNSSREKVKREAMQAEAVHQSQTVNYSSQNSENPESNLQQLQRKKLLREAMEQLSEEQRSVLLLKEFQGLSFPEIAELLNIPENTAKSRLYYSFKALAGILASMQLNKEDLYP
ncbi:MAG: RNA polymerase sigma factor [Balneolales bacterium]|nr:RNA polymerase sigma factor [Balneolales bacterium]